MLARNAITLLMLLSAGCLQDAPLPPASPLPDVSDFPDADVTAASLWQEGAAAKRALASWRDRAPRVEAIRWLVRNEHPGEAMDLLERIVAERLAELPDFLEGVSLGPAMGEEGSADRRRFERFLDDVEAAARTLPDDQAAAVMLSLARPRSRLADDVDAEYRMVLDHLIAEFPGTEAADRARLERIRVQGRNVAGVLAQLDEFIAANPGSCLAVEALEVRGERLGSYGAYRVDARGAGVGPQLLEIVAIAERILGEEFSGCTTVDRQTIAARVVRRAWYSGNAHISQEDLGRLVAAHERLIARLLASDPVPVPKSDVAEVITYGLPGIAQRMEHGERTIERSLDRIESRAPVPEAVRFLRARRALQESEEDDGRRAERLQRARAGFETVVAGTHPGLARRARAELAAMAFQAGRDEEALQLYAEFLGRYPESDWAWVARLRIGQLYEVGGNLDGALAAYAEAAVHHDKIAPAVLLAHLYRARVATALGRFDAALAEYREVANRWDPDFQYGLGTHRDDTPWDSPAAIEYDWVQLPSVIDTIERMERTTPRAEGLLAERAIWLLHERRYADAVALLEGLPSLDLSTPLGAWILELRQRTQLLMALELANVESSAPDDAAAAEMIEALVSAPWSPAVSVARMAQGAMRLRQGDGGASELTRQALQAWRDNQFAWAGNRPTTSGYEEDVRAIRDAVFQPQGGPLYDGNPRGRWNAFKWPEELPPYLLMNAATTVQTADGRQRNVRVYDPLPGYDNILFLSAEQQVMLGRVLDRIGGTDRREPRWVMETPNQPIGGSMAILSVWTRFFPARPGHWSGWEFTAYPRITRIDFLDAERTRAIAHVTIGYGGTSVILEKTDGEWVAVRLSGFWVT